MPTETPAQAARRHILAGRQPVAVERRDKKPSGGDAWQLRRYSVDDPLDAYFPVDGNIGLMLGPASGNLVDVDLDCDEAVQLARTYLPQTGMMHGRPSAPLSHYWYVVDAPTNRQAFAAPRSAGGATLLEIRSSTGSKGFQTVIPPSLHKDTGEQLAWLDDEGQPAFASMADLEACAKVVAAGCLLARGFPKLGGRHEFALALAGALLRYGTPEEDAYLFVYEVCRVGGSTDPGARAQVVRSTARRLEQGDRDVTGIPRLMEFLGEDVAKRVCDWLGLRDTTGDGLRDAAARMMADALPQAAPAPAAASDFLSSFGDGGTINVPPPPAGAGNTKTPRDPGSPEGDPLAGLVPEGDGDEGGDAEVKLKRDAKGKTISCGHNAYLVLKYSDATRECFRWNDVDKRIDVTGRFASVDPSVLDIEVTDWLSSNFDINVDKTIVGDRILRLAMDNRYDPIKEYLDGLVWDGTPRLDTWLERYAGADPLAAPAGYHAFVGRKWLVSSVARAYDPGVKADLVLILEGDQGTGKSSLFEMLGGRWYVDLTISLHDKDAKMLNAGAWISELPDLASLKKTSEINAVKAFFSTRVDKFRPPYGKVVIQSPRRTVYGASTNDLTYLSDVTGNRRFCCVKTNAIDRNALLADRDQLFAEAVHLYQYHVNNCPNKLECCCWWPSRDEAGQVEQEASRRVEDPAAIEVISSWWSSMAPDQRPQKLLVSKVAKDALKCEDDRITKGTTMEVGHALKRLGFKRVHGKVDGQTKSVWHYVPSDELNSAPQSDGTYAVRRFIAAPVKPPPPAEPN